MSRRSEIVGLQYLRGFCAVAVVLDHTSGMAAFPKYFGQQVLGGYLEYGKYGVDIFFVISGFIISIVTLNNGSLSPQLTISEFFTKRFARIVPLMWVAIASYLALRMFGTSTQIVPTEYLRAALLIPYGTVEPTIVWTLRHEFIFYVVFALTMLCDCRPIRWLIVLWFAAPLVLATYAGSWARSVSPVAPVDILFNPVNVEFGCGMLLGLLWNRCGFTADHTLRINAFVFLCVATGGLMALMAATNLAWVSASFVLLMGPLAAVLIGVAARIDCPDNRLSRFGEILGSASYAIYLFHLHFVSAMLRVLSKLVPNLPTLLAVVTVVVGATIAGILVHLLIERPLVQAMQRWITPGRSARKAALPKV